MNIYEQKIEIINAIRSAYENFKQHQKFTSRIRPYLHDVLPGYTIYLYTDSSGRGAFNTATHKIEIWGNGISHNDLVYLSWSDRDNGRDRTWQEGLLAELDRCDQSDYLERMKDEEKLWPTLNDLEVDVEGKIRQAKQLIEMLPIPKSAKLRDKQVYWDNPSMELRKRYPLLFGG